MTTSPEQARSPYAPPYGSTPAYSDGGVGGGWQDGPPSGPDETPVGPWGSGAYGGSEAVPPGPPVPPPAAAPDGRSGRLRRPVALLLACLLSGGVGGALALALDDDGAPASSAASVLRGGTAPAPAAGAGSTQAAAATISPSVVTIAVSGRAGGGFGRQQAVSGTGSGIVLKSDGFIITNNHVVSAAVGGGSVSVTFSDGSTVPATIVGTDPTSDLAVLKVDRTDLTAATFADSEQLAVGQTVIAVGAPLGLSNTVTEGIVSTLDRPVRTGEQGADEQSVIDAVQTDAAINPGNSGGALVDLAGQVVGVPSAIATAGSTGNIGVGFAIPSNDAVEVAEELIADGQADHPQLGINVSDAASTADGTPGQGAAVEGLAPGGGAEAAGLQVGDIITRIDDRAVTDADSLIVAVRDHDPGDTVQVTYLRDGAPQTATATLGQAGS